jgi:putative heme iron utilization protein
MNVSELVGTLLRQLAQMSDVCLVIGANEAVCEAFVDPATMEFRLDGSFATLENGPWHIHMDMDQVHKITFDVKPDTAHNSDQLSYSVCFFDADGRPLLRAFLMAIYDKTNDLRPERVQAYDALRAHAGGCHVVVRGSG